MTVLADALLAYRLRWKRRRLMLRGYLGQRDLSVVADRTRSIGKADILVFSCIRNEAARLPHFIAHYRSMGAAHFLIVDNLSDDGSAEYLRDQPDVSLWRTGASYKDSRFGMDWVNGLLARHGAGHWCLTVDADELFVFPYHDERPLSALTGWLDSIGQPVFPALLLDLYPRGRLGASGYRPGDDPLESLCWFDPAGYRTRQNAVLAAPWVQGGPRDRAFFQDDPDRAPTLTKVPLVRWHWRYAYVNSTHFLLPRRLNGHYRGPGGSDASGVLLHTKFLDQVVDKSREDKHRRMHFQDPDAAVPYYDAVIAGPSLWTEQSARYSGWRQLAALGLMSPGRWG